MVLTLLLLSSCVQEDSSTFVRSTAAFTLGFIGRRAAARRHQEVLEGAVEMLGFALMAPEAEDAVRHHAASYLVLSLQIYSKQHSTWHSC